MGDIVQYQDRKDWQLPAYLYEMERLPRKGEAQAIERYLWHTNWQALDGVQDQAAGILVRKIEKAGKIITAGEKEKNSYKIYYQNGGNGTPFDYIINQKLCDFCIVHEQNGEVAHLKVYRMPKKGQASCIEVCQAGVDKLNPAKEPMQLPSFCVEEIMLFAYLLDQNADQKHFYNQPLSRIFP